jgi:hypothetical protein
MNHPLPGPIHTVHHNFVNKQSYAVYNHVLRLNLNTLRWELVDNYGDIPGVRMGKSNLSLKPFRPF